MMSPVAVFAQESDAGAQAEDQSTLDTITVTARKREETLQDVPVEELLERRYRRLRSYGAYEAAS